MCVFYCRFCIRSGHTPLTPWGKGLWTHLKRTCSSTTSTSDESVLTAWSRDNNNFYCARPLKYCSFGILLATLSLSQILQVIFIQKQSFKQSAGTWEDPQSLLVVFEVLGDPGDASGLGFFLTCSFSPSSAYKLQQKPRIHQF